MKSWDELESEGNIALDKELDFINIKPVQFLQILSYARKGRRPTERLISTEITAINVDEALGAVSKLCEDALSSGRHKPNDWKDLGVWGNLDHAIAHFGGIDFSTGENAGINPSELHILNLACRSLMALQLYLERKK